MTRKNRLMAIVLILCLLSSTAFASSQSNDSHERYSNIATLYCTLNMKDSTAVCSGTAQAFSANTDTNVKLTLRRRVEGSSTWYTVTTWNNAQHGRTTVRMNKTESVSRGYYYQLHIRCTITDANGAILESGNKYSEVVKYI